VPLSNEVRNFKRANDLNQSTLAPHNLNVVLM